MEIKEREWSSGRIFLRHLYFYQEKLRNGNIWAKHPGENLAALFFLFNYCFSCFEFPGCLFLHVLPRWLSHQSDFTGTSVQTNRSWVWKTLYSNLVTQMCVVQQWQGKTSDENRAEKSLQHTLEQNSDFSRARTGASGVQTRWHLRGEEMCIVSAFIHVTARVTLSHLWVCRCPCYISFTLSAITIWHLCRESEFFVLCSASSLMNLVCKHHFLCGLSEKRAIRKISSIVLNPLKMMKSTFLIDF